jgi:hypothetical protein
MPAQSDDFITIVSGLPRSGTSMMMRMLEAGGIPVVVDNIRTADEDNPAGYYEFEPVKQTSKDDSWLESAGGKAVKMVYRLLYDLPTNYQYRVLFMRRKLEEVLASQQKMLQRHGKADAAAVSDDQMTQLFLSQMQKFKAWIPKQPAFSMLEVSYNDLLRDPDPIVQEINDFLGGGLEADAMVQVVEPALYRNRR